MIVEHELEVINDIITVEKEIDTNEPVFVSINGLSQLTEEHLSINGKEITVPANTLFENDAVSVIYSEAI
jgi:hypothetical protein